MVLRAVKKAWVKIAQHYDEEKYTVTKMPLVRVDNINTNLVNLFVTVKLLKQLILTCNGKAFEVIDFVNKIIF